MTAQHTTTGPVETAVLDVRGVQWASEKAVVETVLGRRPGGTRWRPTRSHRPRPSAKIPPAPRSPSWRADPRLRLRPGRRVPEHVCEPLAEAAFHDTSVEQAVPVGHEAAHAVAAPEAGVSRTR